MMYSSGRSRTMRPLGASALGTLFVIACQFSPPRPAQPAGKPDFLDFGPYIVRGPANSAFMAFSTQTRGGPIPTLEYWTQEDDIVSPTTHSTVLRKDDLWYAKMENLPVGPRIYYRVRAGKSVTPTQSFRVGPYHKEEEFRFAAFGDTRTGHDVHRAVIAAMSRENIDFVLHTGDMVANGGVRDEWKLFFEIEQPLLRKAIILPAIGNHDIGGSDFFRHYFLHQMWTKNRRYFSSDWGNLRVIAIDGGIECRDGCDQYAFADRALSDGAKRGMWLVIFLHWPPYSSGHHGSQKNVQGPVSELAKKYGVELVITGHDHNYERTKKLGGVTYIVSGSAGAPIRPVRPRHFSASARTEPHYLLVDVSPEALVLRAINLQGETFDSVILQDHPPKAPRNTTAPAPRPASR